MTKLFCSWCCHFLSKFPSCNEIRRQRSERAQHKSTQGVYYDIDDEDEMLVAFVTSST